MECIVFSLSDWYVTFKIVYSEVFICQRAHINLLPCKTKTISEIPVREVYSQIITQIAVLQ